MADGGHGFVHQGVHFDEIQSVVRKLVGDFVPLHQWGASTEARSANTQNSQTQDKMVKKGKQILSWGGGGLIDKTSLVNLSKARDSNKAFIHECHTCDPC